MIPADVYLWGEFGNWPGRSTLASLFETAGLRVTSGRDSIRLDDFSHFTFREPGGDEEDPQIEAESEDAETLAAQAKQVSDILAKARIVHRFEIHDDRTEEMTHYLHHGWPRPETMDVVLEGLGAFPADAYEAEQLAYFRSRHPELSPEELLGAIFLTRCIHRAQASPVRASRESEHVCAGDLLVVSVGVAEEVFGSDARRWLDAIGIRNSRDFGAAVWNLIRIGLFGSLPDDRLEQFDVHSDLDDFMQCG